jgi:hypothetical protein
MKHYYQVNINTECVLVTCIGFGRKEVEEGAKTQVLVDDNMFGRGNSI